MTTLLCDADILCYQSGFKFEVAEEVEDGYWIWRCNAQEVKDDIDETIEYFQDLLSAGEFILCLSDTNNFRKTIDETYKSNRSGVRRPLILKEIRRWMIEERGALVYPNLEGDDVMGIIQTSRPDTIIVSLDKDMRTIPGSYYRSQAQGLEEISVEEARYHHYFQTLVGDTADGYKGCPGIGKINAKKLLDKDPSWDTVTEAFVKAGQTPDDALTQGRLAKILTADLWDTEKQEHRLWTP